MLPPVLAASRSIMLPAIVLGAITVAVLWIATRIIYLLYWHPLANYPGPKLAAISGLWHTRTMFSDKWPFNPPSLGDVVRIGPNEVSFGTAQAYQDIYGHVKKGQQGRFLKTAFYDSSGGDPHPRITIVRDPDQHARQRRALSHAFSAQSLRDQEATIQKYLSQFVAQIARLGEDGGKALNMTDCFTWITFDIIGQYDFLSSSPPPASNDIYIYSPALTDTSLPFPPGDLAFAEPFGAIQQGRPDPWISIISDALVAERISTALRSHLPLLRPLLLPLLLPSRDTLSHLRHHQALTRAKARRRLARGDIGRADFFSHMLRRRVRVVDDTHGTSDDSTSGGTTTTTTTMPEAEIASQAHSLIIAGSETTATALAAATWHLLRHPSCLARLQREVRPAFASAIITAGGGDDAALQRLPYLRAVIDETLRLFPVVPLGLPRYAPSPASGTGAPPVLIDGHDVPPGTVVSVDPLTLSRSPRYWHEPEAFRPERWLHHNVNGGEGGGSSSPSPFAGDERRASQPFSTGPRGCLGINLAHLELRVILARLVWMFDWELAEELDDWLHACKMRVLWKKPDLWVKYRPVERGGGEMD
ncbi:cytochrome P450 monooxygenase-like protein [Xylariaceae sp. FL0016]|nr:cytochrome P450 monooxygenase-like protein [Xylariaceae sp. FL0016]